MKTSHNFFFFKENIRKCPSSLCLQPQSLEESLSSDFRCLAKHWEALPTPRTTTFVNGFSGELSERVSTKQEVLGRGIWRAWHDQVVRAGLLGKNICPPNICTNISLVFFYMINFAACMFLLSIYIIFPHWHVYVRVPHTKNEKQEKGKCLPPNTCQHKKRRVPSLGKMEYLVFPTEYNYTLERLYGTALWGFWRVNGSKWIEEGDQNSK